MEIGEGGEGVNISVPAVAQPSLEERIEAHTREYERAMDHFKRLVVATGYHSPFYEIHHIFANGQYPHEYLVGPGRIVLRELEGAKDQVKAARSELDALEDILRHSQQPLLGEVEAIEREEAAYPFPVPNAITPSFAQEYRRAPMEIGEDIIDFFAPRQPGQPIPGEALRMPPPFGGAKRRSRRRNRSRRSRRRRGSRRR